MDSLTSLQRQIIAYIIAENEEIEEPNPLTPYMHALSGSLIPDMHFTLYRKKNQKKNELIMYVQERSGEPSEYFRARCKSIKEELLVIADFMGYLAQQRYVRIIERFSYPLDIPEHWQKYEDFGPVEAVSLSFTYSSILVPRLTLYNFWETLGA
jgi:hypothetical protein